MREAKASDKLVQAGSDSPKVATCPSCSGVVEKRKRRLMGGQVTYFYRHKAGAGKDCPLRYRPSS